MEYITLTGYLREVTDGGFYMDCEDGTQEMVKLLSSNPPTNTLIALSVVAEKTPDGAYIVSGHIPNYSLLTTEKN